MKAMVAMRTWFGSLPVDAQRIVVGAISVGLILGLYIMSSAAQLWWDRAAQTARLEQHIARLLGYEEVTEELQLASGQAFAQLKNKAQVGSDAAVAGANLQQRLRQLAAEAQLTVTGSQLVVQVPGSEDAIEDESEPSRFSTLIINLTVEGQPIAIDSFLESVASESPQLAVTYMDLQLTRRAGQRRTNKTEIKDKLSARMAILGLVLEP